MTIQNPAMIFLLLPIALALVLYVRRVMRAIAALGGISGKRLLLGGFLRAFACALLAAAWLLKRTSPSAQGNQTSLSQRGTDAVALVFDISYSMNALDALGTQGTVSRLDAAAQFARILMASLGEVPVSVTIAKGDGIAAIPLTGDKRAVEAFLSALSPTLMSAAGTRLDLGIEAAEQSFPSDVAFRRHIWLFTDGDETADKNDTLLSSVEKAVQHGTNVMFLGFGSEAGCEIVAGDGETKVHTQLKSGALKDIALKAGSNAPPAIQVRYIDAFDSGAARVLLSSLGGKKDLPGAMFAKESAEGARNEDGFISLLPLLAAVLFALSIAVEELQMKDTAPRILSSARGKTVIAAVLFVCTFFGCSRQKTTTEMLKGAWAWRQGETQRAAASFLRALQASRSTGDKESEQYALCNIAAAYIALGEYDAAIERMEELLEDAPQDAQYAAFYNRGVIAYGRGEYEKAVECFRKALLADSTSIDAKANLEIASATMHEAALREEARSTASSQEKQDSSAEEAVFEQVKEQDKKQWKNKEQGTSPQAYLDY